MASSNECREVGGRRNRGIGYEPASQSAKHFLRTQCSETTSAGLVRRRQLEVVVFSPTAVQSLILGSRVGEVVPLCGSQEGPPLPSVKDVA